AVIDAERRRGGSLTSQTDFTDAMLGRQRQRIAEWAVIDSTHLEDLLGDETGVWRFVGSFEDVSRLACVLARGAPTRPAGREDLAIDGHILDGVGRRKFDRVATNVDGRGERRLTLVAPALEPSSDPERVATTAESTD